MIDPPEEIADAAVAFLNGDKSGWDAELRPDINFLAVKTADPTPELELETYLKTIQVFVVPFGERAEKIDRGGRCLEVYSVFLLVVRKLDVEFTRPILATFARQLNLAIRREVRLGGYPFTAYDTTAKYQLEIFRQADVFANSTRFDFTGIT